MLGTAERPDSSSFAGGSCFAAVAAVEVVAAAVVAVLPGDEGSGLDPVVTSFDSSAVE